MVIMMLLKKEYYCPSVHINIHVKTNTFSVKYNLGLLVNFHSSVVKLHKTRKIRNSTIRLRVSLFSRNFEIRVNC